MHAPVQRISNTLIVLIVSWAVITSFAAVVVAAPYIGLGDRERFFLYAAIGVSRSEALAYSLFAASAALFVPTFRLIAGPTADHSHKRAAYRPEIDGLRAIAVVAVIINHINAHWLPNGFLGVDIFFVISGYVICGSLFEDRNNQTLGQFLSGFYGRRMKRIMPGLLFFLLICGVAIALVSPTPAKSLRTALASIFGLSNIELVSATTDYFAAPTQYDAFTHTWSLGVEEQFYLLVPLLLYFTRRNDKVLIGLLSLLVATSCALFLWQSPSIAAFFLMPFRFWEIGAGALAFIIIGQRPNRSAVAVAVLSVVIALVIPETSAATILIVAATSALIVCCSSGTPAYRMLTSSPLVWTGTISYPLYLWHWSIFSIARWCGLSQLWLTLLVIPMIGVAALSHYFIEQPVRHARWKNIKAIGALGYAGITASLLLLAIALPLAPKFYAASTVINPLRFTPERSVQSAMACHVPNVADPIKFCLAPKANRRAVYLVGDSHASNLVPSIVAALSPSNVEFRYLIEWGFITHLDGMSCADRRGQPCLADGFERLLTFFKETLRPRDVVLFSWSRDNLMIEGALPRRSRQQRIESLSQGLAVLRDTVKATGATLVLIDDIPKPCSNAVDWHIIYATGRYDLCQSTVEVSRMDRDALTEILKNNGARYFDPHDSLCHNGICGIYDPKDKTLIYTDNSPHISPEHGKILAKRFTQLFVLLGF